MLETEKDLAKKQNLLTRLPLSHGDIFSVHDALLCFSMFSSAYPHPFARPQLLRLQF